MKTFMGWFFISMPIVGIFLVLPACLGGWTGFLFGLALLIGGGLATAILFVGLRLLELIP